jgi:head-tail adaptor
MRKYMLQENVPTKSPSGAVKDVWTDVQEIDVAVHKTDDLKVVASEKYMQSTHTGVTRFKDITSKHRLKKGNIIYEITSCNTDARLTNLLLKVVV